MGVLTRGSVRLFAVALEIAVTSGAYFAYAPDTAQDGGLAGRIATGTMASTHPADGR